MAELRQSPTALEDLADYRRSVAGMYARVRQGDPPVAQRWEAFRRERDALFASHAQSALSPEQKQTFTGLTYFEYDPAYRFIIPVETAADPKILEVDLPDEGLLRLQRFGRISFEVGGQRVSLSVFWVKSYGGGIFLPFRDLTYQNETYGGGRYLLDTIKNADLGRAAGGLVVDFNFAYNPSCAYNPRWVCPLPPPENRLSVPIRAGELKFSDE
jgi:uncharacterized protein (DUF1684 family)